MYERYGKEIDVRTIKRDLNGIQKMISDVQKAADHHLKVFDTNKKYPCRICGSDQSEAYVDVYGYGYKYFKCSKCGSIYLTNLPTVKQLYEGEPETEVGFYIDQDLYQKRVGMIAQPKAEFVLDIIEQNGITLNSWVDIGCGSGEILYFLKTRGYRCTGIEADDREIAFARKHKLEIVKGFISAQNQNNEILGLLEKANVISFFNVLEHIEKPNEFLDYVWRNTTAESLLVIEVPRFPSLAAFANLTASDLIYRHIVPPIHLQVFSEESIEMMLGNRYELLAKWGFGQGFFDIITNAALQSDNSDRGLYNMLVEICNPMQKIVDQNGLSDQMIYIFKRF